MDWVVANNPSDNDRGERVFLNLDQPDGAFEDYGVFNRTGLEPLTRGLVIADFTNDGLKEVYRSVDDVDWTFYKNTDSSSGNANWIGIRLDAQNNSCNRRGIGATVTVFAGAGTHHQAQVVDGGSGNAGQRDLDLVFGVGSISSVDSVQISWPCGQDQVVLNPPTNEYNTFVLDWPEVVADSVVAYMEFELGADTCDWVFTWKVDYQCENSKDKVIFESAVDGVTELTPSNADAHVVTFGADGMYLHKMTWAERPCDLTATISYRVQSGYKAHTSTVPSGRGYKIFYSFPCPQSE